MTLYEERGQLIQKRFCEGLSLQENVRLREIDEAIDREEEGMLDPLEERVERLERLAKTITECVECLRSRTT